MGIRHAPGALPSEHDALDRWFRSEGLAPRWWSNGPGGTFDWHAHPHHKVLVCQEGGITFRVRDGEVRLGPGDRLDIEPDTRHSATTGPDGVTCAEAWAPA